MLLGISSPVVPDQLHKCDALPWTIQAVSLVASAVARDVVDRLLGRPVSAKSYLVTAARLTEMSISVFQSIETNFHRFSLFLLVTPIMIHQDKSKPIVPCATFSSPPDSLCQQGSQGFTFLVVLVQDAQGCRTLRDDSGQDMAWR